MTLNSLNAFLPVISLIISLAVLFGAFVAFRQGFFKQSSEIQEQTINVLNVRVNTLESQAESDAKEIKRLRTVINTVRYALKRKGLLIEIEGDFVTLIESDGRSQDIKMQQDDVPNSKVRSIKTKNDIDVS